MENMLNAFYFWAGWTAVSSICQIFIALFAFTAIVITIIQIGNRKKVNIGVKLAIKIVNGNQSTGEKVVAVVLEVYNYGLSPLFIKSCWLGFSKNTIRNTSDALIMSIETGFLQPGEYKIYATGMPQNIMDILDTKFNFSNKLYIFLENGMGKIKRVDGGMSHPEFKFEYERLYKHLSTTDLSV